jgi:hypothetical protein
MNKIKQLLDQFTLYHQELRKIKKFFKYSHSLFDTMHTSFSKNLCVLSKGDIHSDVHYFTYTGVGFLEGIAEQVFICLIKFKEVSRNNISDHSKLKTIGTRLKKNLKKFINKFKALQNHEKLNQLNRDDVICFYSEIKTEIELIGNILRNAFLYFVKGFQPLTIMNDKIKNFIDNNNELYKESKPIIDRRMTYILNEELYKVNKKMEEEKLIAEFEKTKLSSQKERNLTRIF